MMTIKAFIERHPLPTYFALTFAISWGGVLLVIGGPGGIRSTTAQSDPLFPFVYLAMLAGPSVAGILGVFCWLRVPVRSAMTSWTRACGADSRFRGRGLLRG